MSAGTIMEEAWWPLEALGDAVEALAAAHGLQDDRAEERQGDAWPHVPEGREDAWLAWAAGQMGIEAVPVSAQVRELGDILATGGPAILRLERDGVAGFLALTGHRRGDPIFLRSSGGRLRARAHEVEALLSGDHDLRVRPEVERILDLAEIRPRRRQRVADAMVAERISGEEVDGITLLRLPATAHFRRQLWQAGIPVRLAQIVGLFVLLYCAELWGWSLIGGATISGKADWGWLLAWFLLLVTMLPWRLLAGWNETIFALDMGRLIKSRLLAGALALPASAVKKSGVGQLIGQVMESQALEALALGGGFSVLVGMIELGFAGWVLRLGAAPGTHLALLGLFTVLTIFLAWGFHRSITAWTRQRLGMTNYLIEAMVGHRTRLAQERAGRRDATEDGQLAGYLDQSRSMDWSSLKLGSGLSSGWSVASLLAFAPALAQGSSPAPASLAISLGGIMLAQRALGGIGGGLSSLSRAGFAWQRVAEIFRAGSRDKGSARPLLTGRMADAGGPVIEGRNLHYAYDANSPKVIDGANVAIARGDRILIEGPSGGGKSTLAGLLTGLSRPDGGLLLLDGLDRPTLGDEWHRHVTSAPQFHENHILSGTLAFNLLMGRQWPASVADIEEAEELCEELGLGDLLRRMPGGIHQRVGETGWQLSHGERSRIFLARALLQKADVTILDESFASLDPATMDHCLKTALNRAETLVVIAHP